ncbi:MAG: TIGR03009 domain-containing protein [Gemmataceae bacterium]|nr:TIGR03009 domain-containing protein [Gemmataceae bacterium]
MRTLLSIMLCHVAAGLCLAQPQGQPALNLNPAGQTPGQAPGLPVNQPPANPRLDGLLKSWEDKMRAVTGLHASVTRTEVDAVEKTTKTFVGEAKFLRPDRAMLYMRSSTNAEVEERYVFTGTYLYEYSSQSKKLKIHEIAPKPGQVVEDNFLNFLFGMKAEDAKRRYEITLAKEDQHYVYLFINPRTAADRQDFTKARLVLWNTTFLPRQLEFEQPNGGVVKWDIPKADPTAKVTANDFTPPTPPKDWQVIRIPRQTAPPAGIPTGGNPPQPSKVRPNGG